MGPINLQQYRPQRGLTSHQLKFVVGYGIGAFILFPECAPLSAACAVTVASSTALSVLTWPLLLCSYTGLTLAQGRAGKVARTAACKPGTSHFGAAD